MLPSEERRQLKIKISITSFTGKEDEFFCQLWATTSLPHQMEHFQKPFRFIRLGRSPQKVLGKGRAKLGEVIG